MINPPYSCISQHYKSDVRDLLDVTFDRDIQSIIESRFLFISSIEQLNPEEREKLLVLDNLVEGNYNNRQEKIWQHKTA